MQDLGKQYLLGCLPGVSILEWFVNHPSLGLFDATTLHGISAAIEEEPALRLNVTIVLHVCPEANMA